MSEELCVFVTCLGDGSMDWSDGEIAAIISKTGNAPKRCKTCRDWERQLVTREIRCQICANREIRTPNDAVGLPKFHEVDESELDQQICGACILADRDTRAERRNAKLEARRSANATGRTYDAFALGNDALRAAGRATRIARAEAVHLRIGTHAVTPADGAEIVREQLANWREPLARTSRAPVARFAEMDHDGMPRAGALPTATDRHTWETFQRRFAEADKASQAVYAALIGNAGIDHALLVGGFGNPEIPSALAQALPRALARVLITHREAAGVFQPIGEHRHVAGRGDIRPWAADLGVRGSTGVGAAYEMIGLDSLIHGASDALPIFRTDVLTLGSKVVFSGVYDGPGGGNGRAPRRGDPPPDPDPGAESSSDRALLASRVGNRRTVEADAMLFRSHMNSERAIGIDFKYASTDRVIGGSRDPRKMTTPGEQIAGIVLAIEQGELHEFHFVSNQRFGAGWEAEVSWGNRLLRDAGFGENRIQTHSFIGRFGA